jgi:hypothetical protein
MEEHGTTVSTILQYYRFKKKTPIFGATQRIQISPQLNMDRSSKAETKLGFWNEKAAGLAQTKFGNIFLQFSHTKKLVLFSP